MTTLAFSNSSFVHAQAIQYITKGDRSTFFQRHKIYTSKEQKTTSVIDVNPNINLQTMEGFGFALTGGSAALIDALPLMKKRALLNEVFGKGPNSLGVSYIRISIGASDLDADVFSYDDLPAGEKDTELSKFSLSKDTLHLIPILQQALKINPSLKIMASPWSPPVWMKTNGQTMGGHLIKDYYASYALYFSKYIKAMHAYGIKINSVTMQNEPEHGGNNPSLLMSAEEQKDFLKNYLGPRFIQENIKTEIVLYDHNADHPNYPLTILADAKARSLAIGTAFHMYLGEESALSTVHNAHPDKKIFFTEQWTGAKGSFDGDLFWHTEHIVIGTINNWSNAVIEWNLAANAQFEPHTPGGCTECKGAFTIQGDEITRNVSYYIIGHVSKFVPSGSKRIASTCSNESIKTCSFLLPNGNKVSIILNKKERTSITLKYKEASYLVNLPAGSVSTIVW